MISIVIPAYNEEKCLYENINEIIKFAKKYDYEIILVDDGSKDKTWEVIERLHNENDNVRGIRFCRNFGKEYALCAGVEIVQGESAVEADRIKLTLKPKAFYADGNVKTSLTGNSDEMELMP